VQVQGSAPCCSNQHLVSKQNQADQLDAESATVTSSGRISSSAVVEMQASGSSTALFLLQLLTAPFIRIFPRFLWTRQKLTVSSITFSCQLFDRLEGSTVAMKVPVKVHVVVQPEGWHPAQYVLSRAPQQLPVTHNNSSVRGAVEATDAECEAVPAAALPAAAAGPGSKALGPFPATASRSKLGKLRLVDIKHNSKLESYRSGSGSEGAHDIVLFEQVCVVFLCMALRWLGAWC
jgi:hypothetical protein